MNEKSLFERAWRIYELDEADDADLNAREFAAVFALAALTVIWLAVLLTLAFVGAHALLTAVFGA